MEDIKKGGPHSSILNKQIIYQYELKLIENINRE